MHDSRAEFLSRLNIESFSRQLMGSLTDAQRAVVLLLLIEAETQAGQMSQNTALSPMMRRARTISDAGDALMASTGIILAEWRDGARTSEEALAALRLIHTARERDAVFR